MHRGVPMKPRRSACSRALRALTGTKETLEDYCINTSIHGMRFIAEPGRHWTERVFWFICCLLSWMAAVYLILQSWVDFTSENALSFNMDTNRLDWDTPFPAVTVCEWGQKPGDVPKNWLDWALATYGGPDNPKLMQFIDALFTIRYFPHYASGVSKCGRRVKCPGDPGNYSDLVHKFRVPCNEIFKSCVWNGKHFNCCQYFHHLETEIGPCFSINSDHTSGEQYEMTSNLTTGPGKLDFEFHRMVYFFIHAREEVPHLGADPGSHFDVPPTRRVIRGIAVTEVKNDPSVRSTTIKQRECRFSNENPLSLYDKYSFAGCLVECRMNAHLESCNCTSPSMPRVPLEKVCGMTGITCIGKNEKGIGWLRLRPKWSEDTDGIYCDCLLNCEAMDIKYVYNEIVPYPRGVTSYEVQLFLTALPNQRFERVVVRSQLDLVVNIGGTLGLLMGASLLSFVEFLHYFGLPLGRALASRYCGGCGACCTGGDELPAPPRPPPAAPALSLPLRRTRGAARALISEPGRTPFLPAPSFDPQPPAKVVFAPSAMWGKKY